MVPRSMMAVARIMPSTRHCCWCTKTRHCRGQEGSMSKSVGPITTSPTRDNLKGTILMVVDMSQP